MVRVFANGPGDLGSIPGRVIPKTLKMVRDASLLNTLHYMVRIQGKVEKSGERSSSLPYIFVQQLSKTEPSGHPRLWSQTLLLYIYIYIYIYSYKEIIYKNCCINSSFASGMVSGAEASLPLTQGAPAVSHNTKKSWRLQSRATRRLPFSQLLHRGVGEGATHFTLDMYLILLSVKQGGIKYYF